MVKNPCCIWPWCSQSNESELLSSKAKKNHSTSESLNHRFSLWLQWRNRKTVYLRTILAASQTHSLPSAQGTLLKRLLQHTLRQCRDALVQKRFGTSD